VIGLALVAFLASIWGLSALVGNGWGLDTSAENRAIASSTAMAELEHAFNEIDAAEDALADRRPAEATPHLDRARAHLDEADEALAAERSRLDPDARALLAEALDHGRTAHEVRRAEAHWQHELAGNEAQATADGFAERVRVLAEANASLAEGDELARQHAAVAEELRGFATEHPLVAATLSLPVDEAAADPVRQLRDAEAQRLGHERVELAFTRAPEERAELEEAHAARLDTYSPARLRTVFGSFDEDGDEELDPAETVAFYHWVEDNVAYRHDDEAAQPEIEGTPTGDGREGTNYQQSPLETYDERLGDCEDTSLLHVAFYRYWDQRAYLAFTSTDPAEEINHATVLLRTEDPEAYRGSEADLRTYEFQAGNELGVEPGTYVIVDNTYSDTFGAIDGTIEPGTFEIADVETLPQAMTRSDDWRAHG
jgi:hypothetical protein